MIISFCFFLIAVFCLLYALSVKFELKDIIDIIPEVYLDVYDNLDIVIAVSAVLLAFSIMNFFWTILIIKSINWNLEYLNDPKIVPIQKEKNDIDSIDFNNNNNNKRESKY